MNTDRLESMQLFLRVADTGSFSKGARGMGLSQSTASRTISRMEARLGAQLLRRSTRGMSLTEAGQEYYDTILRVIAGIDAMEAGFKGALARPTGVLRVALSGGFGRAYVLRHVDEFLDRYPDVDIEFDVAEGQVDLIEEGIDVGIRLGLPGDAGLLARRLGAAECVTVATPAYIALHGVPSHPSLALGWPCVVFMLDGEPRRWRFEGPEGVFEVDVTAVLRTNDAEQVRSAVLEGIGMGQGPRYLYAEELQSGDLVEILRSWVAPPMPIMAVSPTGRPLPRKVQVFLDFMIEKFASHACGIDEGKRVRPSSP
jgi:LysR family transcriptional regulator for bpeEF and oprC